jgi:hypothetical protein
MLAGVKCCGEDKDSSPKGWELLPPPSVCWGDRLQFSSMVREGLLGKVRLEQSLAVNE